ncbi:dockerin type I repeat-containing protein [Acetivibrio clariflavus]|nr:dockerin type I repeat-containing protein [Acetivibrio clariflavus]
MYILGKLTLAEEQLYNADLNNDGRVDSIDYALLKAYLL